VEARDCNVQQVDSDSPDFQLADLWRIDSDGLIISHMSGLCLTLSNVSQTPVTQTTCTTNSSKWQIDESGKLLKSGDLCAGVSKGGLVTDTCGVDTTTVGWAKESSTLVAYPVPTLDFLPWASPHYQVTLSQGDKVYNPYVNLMGAADRDPEEKQGLTNSFVTFSFEGSVTVKVTRLNGEHIKNAVVRPLSSGVEPTIIDDFTVEFKLSDQNLKLSIELDDDWQTNSLFIFGDQLETNVPAMFGKGVRYINVGEHYENHADIASNEVVYVAGGAWLYATTEGVAILGTSTSSNDLKNIKVMGRGVLDGKMTEDYGDGGALISFCGQDVEIEGITVVSPPQQQVFQVNAPWWCDDGWQGNVGGAHVHNVKLMGWNYADGIIAGAKSHVHNIFTRLNDDNVKPMMGDTVFENNVHWQGSNGWAIMIAWCNYYPQSNITVRRSTVIHDDHGDWQGDDAVEACDPCTGSQASIGAVQGGSGSLENVLIEDIVIETKVLRPFWFGIEKNYWANEGTGVLNNWKIKNIKVMQGSVENAVVWGAEDEDQVQSIHFEGLSINGNLVSTFQDAGLELHGHMQDVVFVDGNIRSEHV